MKAVIMYYIESAVRLGDASPVYSVTYDGAMLSTLELDLTIRQ